MEVRYLIIGGGIAGTTAAETLRQVDPQGSITIVSDEPHPLYARISLSKANYFLGLVPEAEMFLKTQEWYTKNNIELLLGRKAMNLAPTTKTVTLDGGTTLTYEKLLIASGTCPRVFSNPAAEKRGIFYLRTLDDARAIIAQMKMSKRAVTIGGGFISFETDEILRKAGIGVTLIIREPYYWAGLLDQSSGELIEEALIRGGVEVVKNDEVVEFLGTDRVEGIKTKNGKTIPCELVTIGIGVICPMDFTKNSGLACEHGVLANEYLETNIQDIWVAGDAAEFYDVVLSERVMLGNWVNSQMQGRAAAQNMAGKKTVFSMVSFYTTQAFGMTIAFVGNVRPAPTKEVIVRGSKELGWIVRLILEENKLEGATMINRTPEMGPITKLISTHVDLSAHKIELADPVFDLKKLLA